jgi:hypothetical protein
MRRRSPLRPPYNKFGPCKEVALGIGAPQFSRHLGAVLSATSHQRGRDAATIRSETAAHIMKLGLSRNTIRVRPQYRSPPITLQGEFASGQRLTDLSSLPDDDRRDGVESSEDAIEIF